MIKGDIILIPFPFADLSGNKIRPALVLIVSEYDVTVCFLTTQLKLQSEFDIIVQPTETNGLKKVSLIKLNKFTTIDKYLIIGRLGSLEIGYVNQLNQNLRKMFNI